MTKQVSAEAREAAVRELVETVVLRAAAANCLEGLNVVTAMREYDEGLADLDESRATLPSAGDGKDSERLDWLSSNTVSMCDHPHTNRSGDIYVNGKQYRAPTLREAIDAAMGAEPSPPPAAEDYLSDLEARLDFYAKEYVKGSARIEELERELAEWRQRAITNEDGYNKLEEHWQAREADLTAALKDLIARFQGAPDNDESDEDAITEACFLLKPASDHTATKEEGQ